MPAVQGTPSTVFRASWDTGSPVASYPSGIQAGEVILLLVLSDNSQTPFDASQTGWTAISGGDSGAGATFEQRAQLWGRTATGSESGTITLTATSVPYSVTCCWRVNDAALADIIAVFGAPVSGGGAPGQTVANSPAITPPEDGSLFLRVMTMKDSTDNLVPSAPSGHTTVVAYSTEKPRFHIAADDTIQTTAGLEAAVAWPATNGETIIQGLTIAVGPAAGASDTTAPVFTSAPAATTVTGTSATVAATIDEDGTMFAVAVADGATAPTSAEVVAGTASGGGAAVASGSVAMTGTVSNTITLTGLTAGVAYDIYVAARDDEGTPNVQASPTLVNVTTNRVGHRVTSIRQPNSASTIVDDTGVTVIGWDDTDLPSTVTAPDWVLTGQTVSGGTLEVDLSASGVAVGGDISYIAYWDTDTPEDRFVVVRGGSAVDLDA